jgi:farnesyl-diphosphate farnesyltransferase
VRSANYLPLLKEVSRSFYITMRVLPRPMREPVSLAYLLARATDTLADAPGIPAEERLEMIQRLLGECGTRNAECGIPEDGMQSPRPSEIPHSAFRVPHLPHPGEARLLERIPRLVEWLDALEPADAADVRWVLGIIAGGQILDIRRFEIGAAPGEVRALGTAEELLDYTYRVAGCVGEFWTRLALRKLRNYAEGPEEELLRLGREFGQGLQLVNILRDFPGDIEKGRCYLPAEELRAAGVGDLRGLREKDAQAFPVWEEWWSRARHLLARAERYTLRLNSWRMRVACGMPAWLGMVTLRYAGAFAAASFHRGEDHLPQGVKVPRKLVKQMILQLLWASRSRQALAKDLGWPDPYEDERFS